MKGGYLINGKNPLVSNVHEAQWIMVLALIMEGDEPKMSNGHPEIAGAYLKQKIAASLIHECIGNSCH